MAYSSQNEFYEIFRKYQPKKGFYSIYGNFGVGKTILALQMSLFSILRDNDVIYLYSKPIFPYKELFRIKKSLEIQDKTILSSHFNLILINNFSQLYTTILNLEFIFLPKKKEGSNPRQIIIDSLTDLYRLELNSKDIERNVRLNYQLNQILGTLVYLKQEYNLDILIINESSKKTEIGEIKEIQAGGNVMQYWVRSAIKIERTNVLNKRKIGIEIADEKPIYFFLNLTKGGFQLTSHT
jgi:RecA/RadA recombinase